MTVPNVPFASQLEKGDTAMGEHRRHFPGCVLVKALNYIEDAKCKMCLKAKIKVVFLFLSAPCVMWTLQLFDDFICRVADRYSIKTQSRFGFNKQAWTS